MTTLEQRFMESVPYILKEIAEQLKIANNLKALELKSRRDPDLTPEMVDSALKNKD